MGNPLDGKGLTSQNTRIAATLALGILGTMMTVQDGAHLEKNSRFLVLRKTQAAHEHREHTFGSFHWLVRGQTCVCFKNLNSAMKATFQENLSRGGGFQFSE